MSTGKSVAASSMVPEASRASQLESKDTKLSEKKSSKVIDLSNHRAVEKSMRIRCIPLMAEPDAPKKLPTTGR